ncbi:hypothetical protein Bbelb_192470 [Branchiostoma belcheri]|nr:hypothetical protein Bbelb_256440 [Branchiostoma belcheri]KAI8502545.1 hypothetical protein Bbelb_192470 [Branchiostoma belcheri]
MKLSALIKEVTPEIHAPLALPSLRGGSVRYAASPRNLICRITGGPRGNGALKFFINLTVASGIAVVIKRPHTSILQKESNCSLFSPKAPSVNPSAQPFCVISGERDLRAFVRLAEEREVSGETCAQKLPRVNPAHAPGPLRIFHMLLTYNFRRAIVRYL